MTWLGVDSLEVGKTSTITPVLYSTKVGYNVITINMSQVALDSFTLSDPTMYGVFTLTPHDKELWEVGIFIGNGVQRDMVEIARWNISFPVSEGTYLFNNIDLDDKYMQIDNNGNMWNSGNIIELHGYDGEDYQKWIVDHLADGYYNIISPYNGQALTAASNENDSITQAPYTGMDNQKWFFRKQLDGTYKLSPKSNLSLYMAAGGGLINSDGRNVEVREEQDDGKDGWILISGKEISLIALPESYDRTSFFDNVLLNMATIGYDDFYENSDIISRGVTEGELVARIATAKISVIRTHGTKNSITTTGGSLTSSDIRNLPSDVFSNAELVIYGACLTANGGANDSNLVTTTYDAGARTVIGFENSVYSVSCNHWCDKFFEYYSLYYGDEDKTILDVCVDTDLCIQNDPYYEETDENGNLISLRNYVVAGAITFP